MHDYCVCVVRYINTSISNHPNTYIYNIFIIVIIIIMLKPPKPQNPHLDPLPTI